MLVSASACESTKVAKMTLRMIFKIIKMEVANEGPQEVVSKTRGGQKREKQWNAWRKPGGRRQNKYQT